MPDQIRSLIVLLPFAAIMFALAKSPASAAIGDADFDRRRNLWLAVTLIAFLAHNFWIYSVLAALLVHVVAKKDSNPLAIYFFIMFAVPMIEKAVPGFAGINYFFNLSYLRILAIVILAPAALRLFADPESLRIGKPLPDKLLIGYVGFNVILIFLSGTFTNFLRSIFLNTIDIFLLYYVASRGLRTREQFRDALMSFAVAAMVMAALGVFEAGRHWMLYGPLPNALGVDWGFMHTVERNDSLRAQVSSGQPIPYGYALAVALGFWLYLQPLANGMAWRGGGTLLLIAGLVASFSRGPWIGAIAIGLVFLLSGPRPVAHLVRLGLLAPVLFTVLVSTPSGEKIIDFLPFVGHGDSLTVAYRQRLLEIFIPIILDNLVFGASSYLYSPAVESLRQGEGIVDLVNTFIAVALYSGLVGLSLFVGFFTSVLIGIWREMRSVADRTDEDYRLGRALFSVLIGVMVIIFTVSSITIIPYIYWALGGVAVAYRVAGWRAAATPMPPSKAQRPLKWPLLHRPGAGRSVGSVA